MTNNEKKGKVRYQRRKRRELIKYMGGKCAWCGFSDIRALQVDHIRGGGSGAKRRRVYVNILKNPNWQTQYQLLCANCNWIKRSERREYPHRFKSYESSLTKSDKRYNMILKEVIL